MARQLYGIHGLVLGRFPRGELNERVRSPSSCIYRRTLLDARLSVCRDRLFSGLPTGDLSAVFSELECVGSQVGSYRF